MKITIDTDSQTDIKKAIKILNSLVEDSGSVESPEIPSGEAFGAMFSEENKETPEEPKADPKVEQY